MNSKFSETVERPLRMLLNQEFVESGRAIPASRAFDTSPATPSIPPASAFGFDCILVPTDFSCLSTVALAYARRLATRLGSEVILLHVCPPQLHENSGDRGKPGEKRREDHRKFAEAQIECQLASTGTIAPTDTAPVRVLIGEGSPHKAIILEALAQKADLIVTAKHGRSAENHLLLGKTAEFLVRNAHCPVLLVGDEGSVFPARMPVEE
jgi:nucleotide-binding universal stress UspA family protein